MDLAYFNGRPFVELVELEEGEWAIVLDGNATITNKDPDRPLPDISDLTGTSFIRPVFSELDTRLQFGVLDMVHNEVMLTPTKYTVNDPNYTSGEAVYPQVPVEIMDTVPEDPSEERVADGPENPEQEGAEMQSVPEPEKKPEDDDTTTEDDENGEESEEQDDDSEEKSA